MDESRETRGEESESIFSRFVTQLKEFFSRMFTLNFLKILLGGQVLSLLICGTSITSQLLFDSYHVSIPTAQSFLNYFLLAVVYCIVLCCRRDGQTNFYSVFVSRWWKYVLVALVDVEANYLVVKAYHYTTLTSIQLLDCITIPVVLILSFFILRVSYRINHVLGVIICIIGVPLMVIADINDGLDEDKPQKGLGDALCLIGASLYGVSNVAEEYAIRRYSRVEFLGMVGLFGTFISGIQLLILEREELATLSWRWEVIALLLAFAICLFGLYSLFPVIIDWSSAVTVNLSILTADVYSILLGIFVFQYTFNGLYFASFSVIFVGIVIYSFLPTKEAPATSRRCSGQLFRGRYNMFKNNRETNSDSEEQNGDVFANDEPTAEQRESLHKAANASLNDTSCESQA